MSELGSGVGADGTQSVAYATDRVEHDVWPLYWARVARALVEVFRVPEDEARATIEAMCRRLIDERGNGASISYVALYHLDPLQVAADLADANLPLTAEQKSIYAEIQMTADRDVSPSDSDFARQIPDDVLV